MRQDQTAQDGRFVTPSSQGIPLLPPACRATTATPTYGSRAQVRLHPEMETHERRREVVELRCERPATSRKNNRIPHQT